uniref:Uncharacterized protein n=1 Tax=Ananas comosus var. bracteatus TaxID=296719 RepID=A0A6V7QXL8_ANACO
MSLRPLEVQNITVVLVSTKNIQKVTLFVMTLKAETTVYLEISQSDREIGNGDVGEEMRHILQLQERTKKEMRYTLRVQGRTKKRSPSSSVLSRREEAAWGLCVCGSCSSTGRES